MNYRDLLFCCIVSFSLFIGNVKADIKFHDPNDVVRYFSDTQTIYFEENSYLDFEIIAYDADNFIIPPEEVKILTKPEGASFDGRTFEWDTDNTDSGAYSLLFYVGYYNFNDFSQIEMFKDFTLKVFDNILEIYPYEEYYHEFRSIDADGDPVEITATGLPVGAALQSIEGFEQYITLNDGTIVDVGPKELIWVPTEDQIGNHTFTIIATDYPDDLTQQLTTQVTYFVTVGNCSLSEEAKQIDINNDCIINLVDFHVFAENWLRNGITYE